MKTELATIWDKTLSEIKAHVSRGTYITLFKETHFISLEGDVATIGVPSVMLISLLQSRFLQEIKKLLSVYTGKNVVVVFTPKALQGNDGHPVKETPLFMISQRKEGSLMDKSINARGYDGQTQQHQDLVEQVGHGAVPVPTVGHLPRVRADFTFSNFAVSSTNQLAFVSAQNVAKNIGKSYNPFFIYGPVGVGKTHLMHAIANDVYRREPDRKIVYITSEEFTNEVVEAIRNNETARMKRRFRSAYLLLIDDIQFIAGKDKVQEELFHTFNILIDNGSQIALSSDRPPMDIKKLEKRLSSRFSGGLTVDIETPDFELRAAIILIKAKKYGYDLPIDVAKLLATKTEDTRSLEGLLLRVITQSVAKNAPISLDLADLALNGLNVEKTANIHAEDIIKYVCLYYKVKSTQLKGPRREAGLVRARQVAMYLLKERLGLTQVEIGNLLGGRDHTTIMYGVDKIRTLVENRHVICGDIGGITKMFDV